MARRTSSLAERELAGINYLVRQLNGDGGVPAVRPGDASGGWTTVEAMEALLRSTWPIAQFVPALERMATFAVASQLRANAASIGGWPFVSGSTIASTMATAHAAAALSVCTPLLSGNLKIQVQDAIDDAIKWIIRHQDSASGGWGVEPTVGVAGHRPRVVATFLALRALAACGHSLKSSTPVQKGVNFLWSMKCGDGFKSGPDSVAADVCSTVRAATALLDAGALTRVDPRLESLISFIRAAKPTGGLWELESETYIPDGASGQIIFNHNTTAEILELLAAVGAAQDLQRELVQWFCDHQNEDGSWCLGSNENLKREIITWPTSEAVLGLSRYIRAIDFNCLRLESEAEGLPQAGNATLSAPQSTSRHKADEFDLDIAVVCAVEDVEFKAVRALDWEWRIDDTSEADDSSSYFLGKVTTKKGRSLRAVAVAAPQMGMPAMAVLAMKVVSRYRPRILATVGIAAAVKPPPSINFGDILFAELSWDYGSGKLTAIDGKVTLSPDPRSLAVEPMLRKQFVKLKENAAALASVKDQWPGNKPATSLSVHIGPIASGAAVVADSQIVSDILEQHRKLVGIEMEIYAIFYAATHSSEPRPTPLAIKSVCDYGDRNKSDTYQSYAAYTSARALDLFVREYLELP